MNIPLEKLHCFPEKSERIDHKREKSTSKYTIHWRKHTLMDRFAQEILVLLPKVPSFTGQITMKRTEMSDEKKKTRTKLLRSSEKSLFSCTKSSTKRNISVHKKKFTGEKRNSTD